MSGSGPMSLREARTKQQKEKSYKNSRLRFRASMKPTRNERSPSEHGDDKTTRKKKIMKVDNSEGEGSDVNMGASGTEDFKITISASGDVEMTGGEELVAKEGTSIDTEVKDKGVVDTDIKNIRHDVDAQDSKVDIKEEAAKIDIKNTSDNTCTEDIKTEIDIKSGGEKTNEKDKAAHADIKQAMDNTGVKTVGDIEVKKPEDEEKMSIEKALKIVCGDNDQEEKQTKKKESEEPFSVAKCMRTGRESPTYTEADSYTGIYGDFRDDDDSSDEISKQGTAPGHDMPVLKDDFEEEDDDDYIEPSQNRLMEMKQKEKEKKETRKGDNDSDDTDEEENKDDKKSEKGIKKDKDEDGKDPKSDRDGGGNNGSDASGGDKPVGDDNKEKDGKDGEDNQKGDKQDKGEESDDYDMSGNGDGDKTVYDEEEPDDDFEGCSEDANTVDDESEEETEIYETDTTFDEDSDSDGEKGIGELNITEEDNGVRVFDGEEEGGGDDEAKKSHADDDDGNEATTFNIAIAIDPYDISDDDDPPSIDEDYYEFLSQDGGSGGDDDHSFYGDDDYIEDVEEVRGTG